MAAPYTLNDSFRVHDTAVVTWLSGLHVDYGMVGNTVRNNVPILTVFATPDRAFASVKKLLVVNGWINGASVSEQEANAAKMEVLPLPLASVTPSDPQPDPEMANVPGRLRQRVHTGGPRKSMAFPGHYSREYTINFWSKERSTDNFIREWVMSRFGLRGSAYNECMLMVDQGPEVGMCMQRFKMLNVSDQSNLEGPDQTFKRVEFTFSLRFWLMRALEEV